MKLSRNFSLTEFTKSSSALRLGIDNTPEGEHLEAAKLLFESVVQPVRDEFGLTVINSGYRCPALNEAIGGAKTSQHCKGEAADIEVPGTANIVVANSTLIVPLIGIVDSLKEIKKLTEKKDKQLFELQKIKSKLENKKFKEKAPEQIIIKFRNQEKEIKSSIEKIEQIIDTIK